MLPVTQMLYIKSIACSLWNIDIKLIILSVFFSAVNVHVLQITIHGFRYKE